MQTAEGCWGYNGSAQDKNEVYARIENLVKGLYARDFQGYCYTQLTDVQQEVNGLLDEEHAPKFDLEILKKIFEGRS